VLTPGLKLGVTVGNSLLLTTENFKSPGTVGPMLMFYHWRGGELRR
jgi:hypothetical protein